MSNEELYQQRLTRILQAVALEAPDRTPVVLEYSGFAAHVTNTRMSEFLRSPTKNIDTMIQAYDIIARGDDIIARGDDIIGGGDAINYGSFWPYALSYDFMAKVRVPGVELPADDMWQVEEYELMQPGDYNRILEMGWPEFFDEFMKRIKRSNIEVIF